MGKLNEIMWNEMKIIFKTVWYLQIYAPYYLGTKFILSSILKLFFGILFKKITKWNIIHFTKVKCYLYILTLLRKVRKGKWTQMWIIGRSKWGKSKYMKIRKLKLIMNNSEKLQQCVMLQLGRKIYNMVSLNYQVFLFSHLLFKKYIMNFYTQTLFSL